ncbi:zinc-binding dehydrogenase [Kitasatospora sp. NPDC001660]
MTRSTASPTAPTPNACAPARPRAAGPHALAARAARAGAGRLRPAVGRVLPLARVPGAIRCVCEGHLRGKVIITVC